MGDFLTVRLLRFLFVVLALMGAALPAAALAQDGEDGDDDEVLVRVNGDEQIAAEERVSVVVVVNGDLEIFGSVRDVAVIVDGDAAVLNGAVVEGEIWIYEGTLTLRDGSRVEGDIHLGRDARLVTETGAVHTGDIRDGEFDWDPGAGFVGNLALVTFASWASMTLVVVLGALVFAGIGGRQLLSAAYYLSRRFAGTLVATIVFWLALLLMSGLLFITLLGIPLVWMLWMFAGIIWFLGYLVFATRLGALVMRRRVDAADVQRPYGAAITGSLILQLLMLLVFGGVFLTLVTALLSDTPGLWGALFGFPTLALAIVLWMAGLFGAGAIVYRAIAVWSGRTVAREGSPGAPVGT